MALSQMSVIFMSTFLISTANAQVFRSRRSSLGRIVAGCIVGALFFLFLLCLCMMMQRRRRARMGMADGGAPNGSLFGAKPLFGGPWGRSNNAGYDGQNSTPMTPYGPNNGQNYNNGHYAGQPPFAQSPQGSYQQAPFNAQYSSQNNLAPPPAYGKEGNYGQTYSPPQGAPGQTSNYPYAAPPGPPPQAHTTGQDNTFPGGFRQ